TEASSQHPRHTLHTHYLTALNHPAPCLYTMASCPCLCQLPHTTPLLRWLSSCKPLICQSGLMSLKLTATKAK
ncbi:hypothetical protein KUCAC02_006336, partial [Chaenocephalus aceratus]